MNYTLSELLFDILGSIGIVINWLHVYGKSTTMLILCILILVVYVIERYNINIELNRSTRWFIRGCMLGDFYSNWNQLPESKYESLIESSRFISRSSNTSITI